MPANEARSRDKYIALPYFSTLVVKDLLDLRYWNLVRRNSRWGFLPRMLVFPPTQLL